MMKLQTKQKMATFLHYAKPWHALMNQHNAKL